MTSGLVGDEMARRKGRLLDPVPIAGPDGTSAGWVVGVGFEGCLLGLVQLDEKMRFRRYASFARRPGSTDGCPSVREWFDPSAILDRASELATKGARLEEPVLSFDRSPDRLVWAVGFVSAPGEAPESIFVTGNHAYVPTGSSEPTTG